MNTLLLTAPSSVRRSRKRAKIYIELHTRLRDDVNCEKAATQACKELLRLVDDPEFRTSAGLLL